MSDAKRSVNPGVALALAGGALTILGVFLPWGKAAVSMAGPGVRTYDAAGMDVSNGTIVLGLGIVVVLAGAAAAVLAGRRSAVLLALAAAAGGALAAILGFMTFGGLEEAMLDPIIEGAGFPAGEVTDLARSILQEAMTASAGWGLYLSILGGLVAVAGGVLLVLAAREDAAARVVEAADDQTPPDVADTTPVE